ncbi:unnamed protein product [Gongylonema pulchrum]|uniref:Myb-like domain-containing protein n=1 Tax=Gongylonema pulchrum TaxID=637853 RepID=A0A183E5X5_9BILA|nr:unnamed protein product [Gongylonema pulchrum]
MIFFTHYQLESEPYMENSGVGARVETEIELRNQKEKEEQLEKERQQLAEEKKLKEAQKKQLADARRKLRRAAENKNYWGAEISAKLACCEAVERACLRFNAERLREITARIESADNIAEALDALKVDDEVPKNVKAKNATPGDAPAQPNRWSSEEISLLVKATTVFPAGTVERWTKVANYINEHCADKNVKKTEKDVVVQAKLLRDVQDQKLRECAVSSGKRSELEWTAEEQKLLEAALRKYPRTDSARWDNIASFVGKSKNDCIKRFKYLAELVKNKKEQAA